MRKLLLNPTPLFRKLRQLSLLLTLLLALPQTAWGQTSYFGINTTNKGNHWVTDVTYADVLEDGSNKISYDIGQNVLTLNSVELTYSSNVSNDAFIAMVDNNPEYITVNLVGNNTLTLGDKACFFYGRNITFTTDATNPGSLTIVTESGWSGTLFVDKQSSASINPTYTNELSLVDNNDGTFTMTAPTRYNLIVGVKQVTSDNKNDVLEDGGSVVFTPATDSNPTNTLTLSGATIGNANTPYGITVSSMDNLTIICAGNNYNTIHSSSSPIYCTDASCDLTFTSEEKDINYIQFNTNATNLVEGFKTVTYVENKAEQFLPQKQIGFITYDILFQNNQNTGNVRLNTKTRTFDRSLLDSSSFAVLSGGGFTFDPATCTLTIQDGTKFGRLANEQLQQSAIYTEIRWGVDEDLKVVINGDCQIIGGVDGNLTFYPFHNINLNTYQPNAGRKISFEKGTGATNVNLALVGADSLKSVLIKDFDATDVSLSSDLKWKSGLPVYNSASLTTNYDITVAGVPVTVAEGKGGITAGTGKIYFDGATKKMTMNGATVGGQIVSNLDELTIEFIGANSAYYILSTNESAPLTINGLTDAQTTTSTLSLSTGTSSTSVVYGFASLDYSNGTYLQSDNACRYKTDVKAIRSLSDVNIRTLSFTTTPYYPVWVYNQQVSSSNSGNVLNDGTVSYNAADHILTLDNAVISNSNVIESELSDNLTIAFKGNNKLEVYTGVNSPIMSGYDTATLKFQKAGTGDCKLNIGFASGVNLSAPIITGFASVDYTTDNLYYVSETGTDIKGSTTYDAMLSSSAIYPLWIAGTIVTEGTSSGTGWSYDGNTNTLTLDNYTSSYDGHAFASNMPNLNVYLKGTNTVGFNNIMGYQAFYSYYTDATLTFSTDENNMGKLDASYYATFCHGFKAENGIYCNNGLGYYPSTCMIEAKKTPTIKFVTRDQTNNGSIPANQTDYVYVPDNGIQMAYVASYYAPKPVFSDDYQLSDTTRYEYTMSVDGIVTFTLGGTTQGNPGKIDYADNGEVSIQKSGMVTITCSFPGNMQNNACSASYTLNITRDFNNPFANKPAEQIYATYYNEYEDLSLPDGIEAYIVTGVSGNSVTTTATGYLPQNTAVLLEKTGNVGTTITGYTGSAGNFNGNLLRYTGTNTSVNTTGKEYILYKNEFVKATGEISAGRCYLDLSGTNLPARGILGIGDDGSTAIEGIDVEATEDETWYDLQGRRIQKPTKAGIYIVNGKKMIINNK